MRIDENTNTEYGIPNAEPAGRMNLSLTAVPSVVDPIPISLFRFSIINAAFRPAYPSLGSNGFRNPYSATSSEFGYNGYTVNRLSNTRWPPYNLDKQSYMYFGKFWPQSKRSLIFWRLRPGGASRADRKRLKGTCVPSESDCIVLTSYLPLIVIPLIRTIGTRTYSKGWSNFQKILFENYFIRMKWIPAAFYVTYALVPTWHSFY